MHPRIVAEGFEIAKEKALEVLEQVKVTKEMDRETLIDVARTSLRTKVHTELADILTEVSGTCVFSPFSCKEVHVLSCCGYSLGKGWIGGCKLALGKTNGPSGDFLFSSLFQAVVDSVLAVRKQDEPIDLHMVEIMEMKHKSETDTA